MLRHLSFGFEKTYVTINSRHALNEGDTINFYVDNMKYTFKLEKIAPFEAEKAYDD